MPRRKVSDLQLKSVWDESLLSSVVTIPRHRNKLWHHLIYSFSTDQPKKLTAKSTSLEDVPYADWQFGRKSIEEIQKNYTLFTTTVVKRFDSARGDTTKLLVRLQDGHEVETVIMRHVTHNTVCISSQIGCQMGCKYVPFFLPSFLHFSFLIVYWDAYVIFLICYIVIAVGFVRREPWVLLET